MIVRRHRDGAVTGDPLLSSPAEPSPHPQGRTRQDEPMLGSSHPSSFGDSSPGPGQPLLSTPRCPEAVMDQDQHQLSLVLPTFPVLGASSLSGGGLRCLQDWVTKASSEHRTRFTVHKLGLYCSYLISW